ncbi:MAG: hypothetical protein C0506_03170 [Anaerolinea sp.]|nr:hypothetical protein [Anaerolinea sp.]
MPAEHTPPGDPAAIGSPYLERKLKPDGSWREYRCTLLHRAPGLVVVRFVMEKGGVIFGTPIEVPPRSVSHGYFWARRPYNLYRMRMADGPLIAHRFDAVTNVIIREDEVSYRDLVLDWWVLPDGAIFEEDHEEFDELRASGALAARDAETAEEAARHVWSRYRHIIDDVEAFERRHGLPL